MKSGKTRREVVLNNQFGIQAIGVDEAKLLCVPSEKLQVTPLE